MWKNTIRLTPFKSSCIFLLKKEKENKDVYNNNNNSNSNFIFNI